MEHFPVRTDLALELRERCEADQEELRGVVVEEYRNENGNVTITSVKIETENGAKALGKPIGTYLTIEAPELLVPDEGSHREISEVLSEQLKKLIREDTKSVLVVGLGNREVTPDALRPEVVGNLYITRHILREYGEYAFPNQKVASISGIVPGVMAQTGMETLEIIKGRPVYLTVDLDVLDPSVFPGTGTPEPGGIDFDTLRRAVTYVCSEANVVGCDVNELAPTLDPSGASTAVACKIVREMLLALQR